MIQHLYIMELAKNIKFTLKSTKPSNWIWDSYLITTYPLYWRVKIWFHHLYLMELDKNIRFSSKSTNVVKLSPASAIVQTCVTFRLVSSANWILMVARSGRKESKFAEANDDRIWNWKSCWESDKLISTQVIF